MRSNIVFVVKVSGGKASWIEVTKGRESNGNMEVYGRELSVGDEIVKSATDEIRNGGDVGKTKIVE